MSFFAVIDADGYVLRVGRCATADLPTQADEGEEAVEIGSKPLIRAGRRYRVEGGEVVEA